METIFMNTGNSKANKLRSLTLTLADRLDLKGSNKNMTLANYTWKNIKSAYINNKFKIPAPTWND